MTTLNDQIIEALKLGIVFARREARLFDNIPSGALPMFYVTGRESDDRAEAVKMAQRIETMERVLAETEASAHLIAAAPDLLEALKGLLRTHDNPADPESAVAMEREIRLVEQARAAVKKATSA